MGIDRRAFLAALAAPVLPKPEPAIRFRNGAMIALPKSPLPLHYTYFAVSMGDTSGAWYKVFAHAAEIGCRQRARIDADLCRAFHEGGTH